MIRVLLAAATVAVATMAAAPPVHADPYGDLWSLLPAGYDTGSCQPIDEEYPAVRAALECVDNSLPGGPRRASYALYVDAKRLAEDFQRHIAVVPPYWAGVPCPGWETGETTGTWTHTDNPNLTAGRLACGVITGTTAEMVWTKDSDLLLAVAGTDGPDLTGLYRWFLDNPRIGALRVTPGGE